MRIHKKITLSMLLTAMVPLIASTSVALWNSTDQTTRLTLDVAQGRLDTAAQQLSRFFSERISEISTYSQMPVMKVMEFEQLRPFLMGELKRHAGIYEKYIVGTPEGHFYNTSGGNPGVGGLRTFNDKDPDAKPKHIRKRDYWQQTVGRNQEAVRKTYVSDPMISYTTGAKQVVVASTILSSEGKLKGMIGGALPWSDIQLRINQVKDSLVAQLDWDAKFFLISQAGTYWYHWNPKKVVHLKLDENGEPFLNDIGEKEVIKNSILDESIPAFVSAGARMTRGESGYVSFKDYDSGIINYVIFSSIPSAKYSIGIVVPRDQILAPVGDLQSMLTYTFLGAAMFVIFVALGVSKRVASPVVSLNDVIKEVSKGDWSTKLKPVGSDEISELTESFNAMSKSLEMRELSLKKSEDRLESINEELEEKIKDRTKELELANKSLKDEVNERKYIELALRRSDDLMKKTGRLAHVGGWKLDVANNNLSWTDETYRIHGVPKNITPKIESIIECYPPDSRAQFLSAIEGAINSSTPFDLELLLKERGDKQTWVRVICGAEEVNGKVVELIGAYQDITELKQLEKLKNEFVSTVSHELRTPLTSIYGSLSLLLSGKVIKIENKTEKNMLEIAERNCERLLLLINDLLDMDKIESGKMDYNIEKQELMPLLEQSIKENHSYGQKYNVQYNLQSESQGVKINVDKERLLQVMSNLLSNAAKFTSPKTNIDVFASEDEKGFVQVFVRDYGQGIPEEFKDRLFDKFSQADSSDTRKQGGTGLGLSICKSIIEQMGGELSYDSIVGEGSTFYFTFPVVK